MIDYSAKSSMLCARPMKFSLAGYDLTPPWWGLVATLGVILVFCRLGVWQLDRAQYKQSLIDDVAHHATAVPLDWAALQSQGADARSWPVRLQGAYDNAASLYQINQFHDGKPGVHVLTVFKGGEQSVLVDRGWLASTDYLRLPAAVAARGSSVSGVAVLPANGLSLGAPDYSRRPLRVLSLDPTAIGRTFGIRLLPVVIRLDPSASDGFDRHWPPVVNPEFGPERSRGYAFQWFSMAGAVAVIFIVINSKRRKAE